MSQAGDGRDSRKLFDAGSAAITLRSDLTVTTVSDAYLKSTGLRREDFVGRNILDVARNLRGVDAGPARHTDELDRLKNRFLSDMSHELRTPLNAVIGFSELLIQNRYGEMNDKQSSYVRNVHSAGQQLLRLINDILDLSKIEAGQLDLTPEDLSVDSAVLEAIETVRPLSEKKNVQLAAACPLGLTVRADAARLQQVLTTLIANAIKYTPENGAVTVSAISTPDGAVRVEVAGDGTGIPEKDRAHVFEAFFRGKDARTGDGTGLGLAIARKLVEAQGGQCGLDDPSSGESNAAARLEVAGQGSRFFFTLPAGRAPLKSSRAFGGGRLILVVEDDPAAAEQIGEHLQAEGYHVHWTDEPESVVETAARLQPAAITLDVLMRPLTGWQVLGRLKDDPRTAAIPTILVSAIERKSIGALLGADDHLVKPVDRQALARAIERCLGGRQQTPPEVLVVDDDSAVRETVRQLLEGIGCRVALAASGEEAQKSVAASLPSVVILDLMLPGVGGFDLLAQWRADPRTSNLRILVLTAKDLTATERKVLLRQSSGVHLKSDVWGHTLLQELERILSPAGEPVAAKEGTA